MTASPSSTWVCTGKGAHTTTHAMSPHVFTCYHCDSCWAGLALATSSPKCSSVCAIEKG